MNSLSPLPWLGSFKTALIVGGVALTIGFASGYVVKGKFVQAAEVKGLKADIVQSGKNEQKSLKESVRVTKKIGETQDLIGALATAANARIAQSKKEASDQTDKCPTPVLDVGTVRMLNAARSNLDTTGGSDAAVQATPPDSH